MADTTGSITLSRKFFDSIYWRDGHVFSRAEAWIDLIRRAVFKTTTVHIEGCAITLGRGEFCYAVRTLAEDWKWSKSSVQRFIAHLVEHGRLEGRSVMHVAGQKMGQVPTVYRLVNYDLYQLAGRKSGTVSGTESGTSKKSVSKKSVSKNTFAPSAPEPAEPPPAEPPSPAPKNPPISSQFTSWAQESANMAERAGYFWEPSRVAKALRPHVERDGWDWVYRAWRSYLSGRATLDYDNRLEAGKVRADEVCVPDHRFVRPEDFASNYGYWDKRVTPSNLLALKAQGQTGWVEGARELCARNDAIRAKAEAAA